MSAERIVYAPARCKTGLAAARRYMRVHRVAWLGTALVSDRLVYRATWLCGKGSDDAVVIADPEPHGGVCEWCDDTVAGPAVYRYFDADGQLLYVGSTEKVLVRRKEHIKRSPWWAQVAREQIDRYRSIAEARSAEVRAIRSELPAHNKVFRAEAA